MRNKAEERLPRKRAADREQYLLEKCRGKTVLHLGCVDPLHLEEAAPKGQLLHQRLQEVAKELWGLDTDEVGIRWMKEKLGTERLLRGDVERLAGMEIGRRFDVVLAGEIIEHLANPGLFLEGVREHLHADGVLLVSVPNALSIRAFLHLARGHERVHSDHVCWYSPRTITHLLNRYGFRIEDMRPYYWSTPSTWGGRLMLWLVKALCAGSPWLADGIVLTAKPDGTTRRPRYEYH